eukprot:6348750-Pyramimonas_sp.AAC.1
MSCASPRPRQGGTAILWRPAMGKGAPASSPDDWRQCHRRFEGWALSSVYGPAGREDSVWFAGSLDSLSSVAGPFPAVAVGDFNWKP